MGALTEHEKECIRAALGYLETSFAASLQLGIPRPTQTLFLLEQSLTLLTNDHALARMRNYLATVARIEQQMQAATCQLAVEKIGDITMRGAKAGQTYPDLLEREYVRWAKRIADMLGVMPYPYSERFRHHTGARMVPVSRG